MDGAGWDERTHIGAFGRHVAIVLPREGRLGAFLPDDAELLRRQHGLPLVLALLDRVVRHVSGLLTAEQGAEEGDAGHGPEEEAGRVATVGEGRLRQAGEGRGDIGEGEGSDEGREGWDAHVVWGVL